MCALERLGTTLMAITLCIGCQWKEVESESEVAVVHQALGEDCDGTPYSCDDGLFCNGTEVCSFQTFTCVRDEPGPECDDGLACTRDWCSEDSQSCRHDAPDMDGDGHLSAACLDGDGQPLGDDCNDNDGNRFPGNLETCDNHDEDCDGSTFGTKDYDGDGYIDIACCNGNNCGDDCDDARSDVHPNLPDGCDDVDTNCNGVVDEGCLFDCGQEVTLYPDEDRDGFGDVDGSAVMGCPGNPALSQKANDCDDSNPAIRPGSITCFDGEKKKAGEVAICSSQGLLEIVECPDNGKCVPQPNGTGVCD